MDKNFLELQSSQAVLKALQRAATRETTPQERLEQRVSFVYGSVDANNGVTRERVREIILQQQGVAQR